MTAFRLPEGGAVDRGRPLAFTFDGRPFLRLAGDSIASALIANGVRVVGRSFKYHRPRGIWGAWTEEPNAIVDVTRSGRTLQDHHRRPEREGHPDQHLRRHHATSAPPRSSARAPAHEALAEGARPLLPSAQTLIPVPSPGRGSPQAALRTRSNGRGRTSPACALTIPIICATVRLISSSPMNNYRAVNAFFHADNWPGSRN